MQNDKKNNVFFKIIKVILFLIFLIIIFSLAPNYEVNDTYAKDKINIIINNNNVTKKLKKELFISDESVIYMSMQDIKNYFDKYIIYDERNNQIITTYGEKVGVLPLNQNIIKINDSTVNALSGAIKKEDIYYLPISLMGKVYNLDIEYLNDEKILM